MSFVRSHFGKDGKAEAAGGEGIGNGEFRFLAGGEAFLLVKGNRVVNFGPDAVLPQMFLQAVPSFPGSCSGAIDKNRELVPDRVVVLVGMREPELSWRGVWIGGGGIFEAVTLSFAREKNLIVGEEGVLVAFGVGGSGCGEICQVWQFHAKQGRLQGIKAEISTNHGMVVFRVATVDPHQSGFVGQGGVVGKQGSSVPEAAEVFGGEETEGAEISHGTGGFSAVAGTKSLGSIFEDHDPMVLGDFINSVHFGALTEKVNGNDGLSAGGKGGGEGVWVEVETDRTDICENRFGTDTGDASGGGKKAKGGANDLITGAYIHGHEGQ